MTRSQLYVAGIATPDGEFTATYSERGLCRLEFPAAGKPNRGAREAELPSLVKAWHELTSDSVRNILAARPPTLLPPLDLSSGTDFQKRVWRFLRQIACGQTRSYGEVAAAIERPRAFRAVGAACGANPIPLLIPCHRVLAANQRLGGFSGGLEWKRLLLSRERSWPNG